MLGRKGVLISDPSVAAMTDAQWIFEAYSLREVDKEKTHMFEAARDMLMSLLGLNLFRRPGDAEDSYMPLSLICGNPHVLKSLFEEKESGGRVAEALEDKDFDEWSEQMAAGDFDDDMVPLDEPTIDFTSRSPTLTFDED